MTILKVFYVFKCNNLHSKVSFFFLQKAYFCSKILKKQTYIFFQLLNDFILMYKYFIYCDLFWCVVLSVKLVRHCAGLRRLQLTWPIQWLPAIILLNLGKKNRELKHWQLVSELFTTLPVVQRKSKPIKLDEQLLFQIHLTVIFWEKLL